MFHFEIPGSICRSGIRCLLVAETCNVNIVVATPQSGCLYWYSARGAVAPDAVISVSPVARLADEHQVNRADTVGRVRHVRRHVTPASGVSDVPRSDSGLRAGRRDGPLRRRRRETALRVCVEAAVDAAGVPSSQTGGSALPGRTTLGLDRDEEG